MATCGRDRARSRESMNAQPVDNHAEFMVAMENLANTIEANAAATLQAVQRLGQPAGNGNGIAKETRMRMLRKLEITWGCSDDLGDFSQGKPQHWWQAECRLLQLQNVDVPWDVFQTAFYKKYFPESTREPKEMELMQLKQGSLSVADYTSIFEELCRFSRVCQGALETYESWKCIKYQRGLKDNIMTVLAPLEIRTFSELVNKARVVEEYAKMVASSKETHRESSSGQRGKYFHPKGQNFKRGGYAPQGQRGFRKNAQNQFQYTKGRGNQSKISLNLTCVRCGHFHPYDSCMIGLGGYFNCGLLGHIASDCTHGKNPNAGQSQHQGRVFAMNAKDASKADLLMRGICLIGDKVLIALYDTGALHSFISFAKVEELGLKVLELAFDLHVHTPHQTVMTRSGCRQVGFMLEGRDFVHDLICLLMIGFNMILGFDWLSKNWVLLDCFERSFRFMPEGENGAAIAEGYYMNSVVVHLMNRNMRKPVRN
ncbi:uncharacterized protein LOC107620720 [Arachis ipaensis]|uniref:uncharacterized protein LOC107620720 n=1 Tax=Arachis ipaensis TaxID=130454 RepID=UPI0007AF1FA4|nr:uncharacterized protein LOC107620720 [Arachis ipaensis]